MKGNIKKLAMFMVVAVMATFIMVDTAGAQIVPWYKQSASYAMMASGTCLLSSGGFNPNYTPIGTSWGGSSMATGIWTFKADGTGTVQGTSFVLTLPPPAPPYAGPSAGSQDFSFNFTYKVTDGDMITVDMVGLFNGTYLTGPLTGWTVTYDTFHLFGNVSADRKTITLASGNQSAKITGTPPPTITASPFTVYQICNIGRVLTHVAE